MNWFDSVCHTFATLATGGFGTRNASIAAYDSVAIDVTIIFFMVLAGANFGLYYQAIRGRFTNVWKDPELRLYLSILAVASIFVVGSLFEERIVFSGGDELVEPSFGAAVRHGVFQVVSIQTTTGFVTADFDRWGFVPKAVLIGLMFIGGSAGSTGGGIKVIRVLIAFKVMLAEVERVFRPNVVRPIKIGHATVDAELRLATLVYIVGIFALFIVGALLLMVLEQGNPRFAGGDEAMTFATAATASAATLNNIGPGLELVGAVQNYGWFSTPSLIVMSLLMVLGRLEVYAVFVLFVPRFWRTE
jgi:trk system potassium uptake protein TrkH